MIIGLFDPTCVTHYSIVGKIISLANILRSGKIVSIGYARFVWRHNQIEFLQVKF